MRYLVKARPLAEKKNDLLTAINNETLGTGSVAFGEYVKNMKQARELDDGTVCWVEVCFCAEPLNEEMPYWQVYFTDIEIEETTAPEDCMDFNGADKRACFGCDCTKQLEEEMLGWGKTFIP